MNIDQYDEENRKERISITKTKRNNIKQNNIKLNKDTASKELQTGRIAKVQRDLFTILTKDGEEISARLKGILRGKEEAYPLIGDYVKYQYNPYGDSLISDICERKSIFKRVDLSGHAAEYAKTVKEQALAANFDYVFIIASLNQNYNVNRIARYISTTLSSGAKPVVVLTKADLCKDSSHYVDEIKQTSDKVEVYAVSAKEGRGLEQLKKYMIAGTTIVFLGSSGVGKSTLVNTLAGEELMKVSEIRAEDARGRHTTTHRELTVLKNGVCIIDTPGIRELGLYDAEEGIKNTFSDITDLFTKCKYHNCTHRQEPGCAVREALSNHTISGERWELYQKLINENTWGVMKTK